MQASLLSCAARRGAAPLVHRGFQNGAFIHTKTGTSVGYKTILEDYMITQQHLLAVGAVVFVHEYLELAPPGIMDSLGGVS